MVGIMFPFFMYAFICAHYLFPCLITFVLTFLVQMECRIFFMSYSCSVRSSLPGITYECRRPQFDVDATREQEVLMLTPSCVAAVDVLINGRALSTQAQRSALTHFVICPLLVLLLLIPSKRLCAHWLSSLPRVQVPTLVPFLVRVHTHIFYDGAIFIHFFS